METVFNHYTKIVCWHKDNIRTVPTQIIHYKEKALGRRDRMDLSPVWGWCCWLLTERIQPLYSINVYHRSHVEVKGFLKVIN